MPACVAIPTSKVCPHGVQCASFNQRIKSCPIRSVSKPFRRLSTVQSMRDESSDQVPGGWLKVPWPLMVVTGFLLTSSLLLNSTGTPSASPIIAPQRPPSIFSSVKEIILLPPSTSPLSLPLPVYPVCSIQGALSGFAQSLPGHEIPASQYRLASPYHHSESPYCHRLNWV